MKKNIIRISILSNFLYTIRSFLKLYHFICHKINRIDFKKFKILFQFLKDIQYELILFINFLKKIIKSKSFWMIVKYFAIFKTSQMALIYQYNTHLFQLRNDYELIYSMCQNNKSLDANTTVNYIFYKKDFNENKLKMVESYIAHIFFFGTNILQNEHNLTKKVEIIESTLINNSCEHVKINPELLHYPQAVIINNMLSIFVSRPFPYWVSYVEMQNYFLPTNKIVKNYQKK